MRELTTSADNLNHLGIMFRSCENCAFLRRKEGYCVRIDRDIYPPYHMKNCNYHRTQSERESELDEEMADLELNNYDD